MSPITWTHVFVLLAAVVVSDDLVMEEELDSFTDAVHHMCEKMKLDGRPSHEEIMTWFNTNQKYIRGLLTSPLADSKFTETIMALSDFSHKELLLENMQRISMSDNDVHEAEFDLIVLSSALWGIMPSQYFKQSSPKKAVSAVS